MKTWETFALAALVGMAQLGCDDDKTSGTGSCGAFSGCGGDLTGTWTVDGICVDGDLGGYFVSSAGLSVPCNGLYQDIDVTVSGTVNYANGVEAPDFTMSTTMAVQYSQACLSAQAGQTVPMSQTVCDSIVSTLVANDAIDSATCLLAGSACNCTVVQVPNSISETDTYTASGNTLSFSGGDKVEYCVSGTTLTMRKFNLFGTLPAQFTLHR